jgi:hypothetical protein
MSRLDGFLGEEEGQAAMDEMAVGIKSTSRS